MKNLFFGCLFYIDRSRKVPLIIFVDENGNRDSELSGHDKAVHTLGEWDSVKECKDNGDFDKDYVYIGTFSKADKSDEVMISSVIYTQEECDVYLNGKTFKSYLDDEIKEGGKHI